jgi:hypothetical protein
MPMAATLTGPANAKAVSQVDSGGAQTTQLNYAHKAAIILNAQAIILIIFILKNLILM